MRKFRENVVEGFDNGFHFNYYIEHSTGLQINDKQIKIFTIMHHDKRISKRIKLGIVNYDLHSKTNSAELLYGIITKNNNGNTNDRNDRNGKWSWKLSEFLTADKIATSFNIQQHELPKSSREKIYFEYQLFEPHIDDKLIDNTDWKLVKHNIEGIKKKNFEIVQICVELNEKLWIEICKKSFLKHNLPFIPIVVNKDNYHYIEWIKIIYIESQNVYTGVGFTYFINKKLIISAFCNLYNINISVDILRLIMNYCPDYSVSCIELDLDYVCCGHRLLGSTQLITLNLFAAFRPWITNLIIS